MSWLVILTFIVGVHSERINVPCPDKACVERLITDARLSPTLRRFRAYSPSNLPGIGLSQQSAFPADIDIVFN